MENGIQTATINEYLKGWHGGNWRNSNSGEPIIPIKDFREVKFYGKVEIENR